MLAAAEARGKAEVLGQTSEAPPDPEPPRHEPPLTIWAKNGLSLSATEVGAVGSLGGNTLRIRHSTCGTLLGQLTGRVSERALLAISDELVPAVRAILRSVSLLRPPGDPWLQDRDPRLPTIKASDLLDYRAFITGCASLIYPVVGKKDSMARRFSNATRLLSQADQQTSAAVALALSVTAIEALLGKKGSDISSSLADHIPVLLEPKAERRCEASKFVKDLYDSRSRTLHGEQIDLGPAVREKARTLAAACLYGLWFRNDFKARLDEPADTPEALLEELKGLKWVGRLPDGVPEVPAAWALWDPTAGRGGVGSGV